MIIVDDSSGIPPFEQIRSQLSDLIKSGALLDGQRLPAIRQLAGDLRVAPGTVARAYAELETSGLVTTGRGQGTRVCAEKTTGVAVQEEAAEYVQIARRNGIDLDTALAAVRAQWGNA